MSNYTSGIATRRKRSNGVRNKDEEQLNTSHDDSDDEKDHGGHAYAGACSMGRFFLNPCLCLLVMGRTCYRRCYQSQNRETRKAIQIGLVFLLGLVLFGSFYEYEEFRVHPLRPRSDWEVNRIPIVIRSLDFSNVDDLGGWTFPSRDRKLIRLDSLRPLQMDPLPDYGNLTFHSIADQDMFSREIDSNDESKYEQERKKHLHDMNKYYLSESYWHDDELDAGSECRRPNWVSLYFPTCNEIHQVDMSRDFDVSSDALYDPNYDSYYFSHGYYRDAWLIRNLELDESTVMKSVRFKHVSDHKSEKAFFVAQRDAIVMERLTASPRIINMYSHCGSSLLVQTVEYEVEEYIVPEGNIQPVAGKDDVQPRNDYTPLEKLEMAIRFAESIADLHGYEGGVIVHDDVQLCQWLRTKDDEMVLGDFNRAEIMEYNEKKHKYCKYNNGECYGNYRSPEEYNYEEADVNERIDVWSLGNNIYALLTGLWPFDENDDDEFIQKQVIAGKTSFIDDRYRTRSFIEGKLVEAIEMCWRYDPKKRVDVFELVKFLRSIRTEEKINRSMAKKNGYKRAAQKVGATKEHRGAAANQEGMVYSKDK